MSPNSKRKGSPSLGEGEEPSKRRFTEVDGPPQDEATEDVEEEPSQPEPQQDEHPQPEEAESKSSTPAPEDRAARFAALRARNAASRKSNLKEVQSESKRSTVDPAQLTALSRRKNIAEHKLLKSSIEESGGDFERKRAWDWTAEEAERWDERLAEKARKRDDVGFADYRKEAGKVYDRQVGMMEKDKAGWGDRVGEYEREKSEAVERAVRSGGLEIVETETGELIAVDRDGRFFSTADVGEGGFGNKPSQAAIDRLVLDIKKAEEVRLKKRREREGAKGEGDGDVTYINEKNKQFNLKLKRFYDKYTSEIRDSFERGTAI